MTPREIEPMTLQEIEDLRPGLKTDAEIEQRFFGFLVYGLRDEYYLVDEHPDDPDVDTRDPWKFSSQPEEALKILEASPGWRAWHETEGLVIQLTRTVGDGLTWITGIGRDKLFEMAICKAALTLVACIKEWEARQATLDMAGDVTLEMTAEFEPAAPENLITIKDEGEA